MQTVQYRRWSPPSGAVQIEFVTADLQKIKASLPTTSREEAGLLVGVRYLDELRIVDAIGADAVTAGAGDYLIAQMGLEAVGIYAVRKHGEVFLTESDLARLERSKTGMALVIAGNKAGFFVPEADGTIQSICSHEEFSLGAALEATVRSVSNSAIAKPTLVKSVEAEPIPVAMMVPAGVPAPSEQHASRKIAESSKYFQERARGLPQKHAVRGYFLRMLAELNGWVWRCEFLMREFYSSVRKPVRHPLSPPPNRWHPIALLLCALIIPMGALAYFQPRLPKTPIALTLREVAGQLIISWDSTAARKGARLEIVDNGRRTEIAIKEGARSTTYLYSGNEIEVRLVGDGRSGNAAWSAARFVTPVSPSFVVAGRLQQQVKALRNEAHNLEAGFRADTARIEQLKREADALVAGPVSGNLSAN